MKLWICSLIFVFYAIQNGRAQIRVQQLTEVQYGNLPTDTSSFFPSLYNRTQLNYQIKKIKLSAAIQQYYTSFSTRNYLQLQQIQLDYYSSKFSFQLGHIYQTVARGMLLRTFEVPGALFEELSFRSRQQFYRDLLGGQFSWRRNNLTLKGLFGLPLINTLPPTFKDQKRRLEKLSFLGITYQVGKHAIEGNILANNREQKTEWLGAISLTGPILPFLQYTGIWSSDGKEKQAFYANINIAFPKMGITVEYKDYQNFVLGSSFNEPPALVKEHGYRVLNRMTHVPIPQSEKGYQLEAFILFDDLSMLTLNHAVAINQIGGKQVYREYFIEYQKEFFSGFDAKTFLNYAVDPIQVQTFRLSGGIYGSLVLDEKSSLEVEWEYQRFDNNIQKGFNQYYGLAFSSGNQFSTYLSVEASNDQLLLEQPYKLWIGGGGKFKIGNHHTLTFFAGERRGGPACTAGICYNVLDFKGFEVRWNSTL
jgi:PIN domain nuclease of toxin-antitoxin system